MSEKRTQPRPERQRVMRKIERACDRRPHSIGELVKITKSTRGSINVLLHRMRGYKQIVTLNPGTLDAVHLTPALAMRLARAAMEGARR